MTLEGLGADRAGGAFDVRARITNAGAIDVTGLEVEGRLAAAGASPPSDAGAALGDSWSLGRRTILSTIPRGGFVDFAERYVLPADLPPGAYDFRLVLDPDARLPWTEGVVHWSEGLHVEVRGPTPQSSDLAVSSMEVTPRPGTNGRRLGVSAMLLNRGPGVAPAFDVETVLVSGGARAASGGWWLPLGTRTVPGGVPAGAETRARFDVEVPAELPAGEYRVVVRVDPRRTVDAVRGADDSMSRDVVVGDAPPPAPGSPPPLPAEPPPAPPASPPAPSVPPALPPSQAGTSTPKAPAADPSLPLPLAPLLPSEGLTRDRSQPVTFLLSHSAERRDAAVLDVLLEQPGAAGAPATSRLLSSFDVPAGPAGVVTAVKGRLRAPPEAPAGDASLLLVVRASSSPDAPARDALRVPVTIR
jgi:hypothetical protein